MGDETQVLAKQGFEHEAAAVLGGLRTALAAILSERQGSEAQIERAAHVCRAFGVDRTLGWRVFRIAHAPTPLECGTFVPRRAQLAGFLEAAVRHGVSAQRVDAAHHAFDRFEAFVQRRAGDRKTFDSMVAQWNADASNRLDVSQRRASFRAHRHLLGLAAKVDLESYIIHPGAEPGRLDLASVGGWVDLRRLRPFTRFALAEYHLRSPSSTDSQRYGESLGPDGPLLPRFSSQALPELHYTRTSAGRLIVEMEGERVGSGSPATYFLGQVRRGIRDPGLDPEDAWIRTTQRIRVPSQVLVMDCLLARSLYGPLQPRATVWWDALQGGLGPGDPDWREYATRLSVFEPRFLGTGSAVLHVGKAPQYADCVKQVCEQLNWEVEGFDVYRCEVEFPLVNSMVEIRFDLGGQDR